MTEIEEDNSLPSIEGFIVSNPEFYEVIPKQEYERLKRLDENVKCQIESLKKLAEQQSCFPDSVKTYKEEIEQWESLYK